MLSLFGYNGTQVAKRQNMVRVGSECLAIEFLCFTELTLPFEDDSKVRLYHRVIGSHSDRMLKQRFAILPIFQLPVSYRRKHREYQDCGASAQPCQRRPLFKELVCHPNRRNGESDKR